MSTVVARFQGLSHQRRYLFGFPLAYAVSVVIIQLISDREAAARAAAEVGGSGIPDLSFGYSYPSWQLLLTTYGESARIRYLWASLWDLFPYMWLYTLSLVLAIARVMEWAYGRDSAMRWFLLSPFIVLNCDILENLAAIYLTVNYPKLSAAAVLIHTINVTCKWVTFITITVMLLLTSLIRCIFRPNKRKSK